MLSQPSTSPEKMRAMPELSGADSAQRSERVLSRQSTPSASPSSSSSSSSASTSSALDENTQRRVQSRSFSATATTKNAGVTAAREEASEYDHRNDGDRGDDDDFEVPSLFDSFTPSHKDFWHMAATLSADDIRARSDDDDYADPLSGSAAAAHNGHCSCFECADGECACCCSTSLHLFRRKMKTFAVIVLVGALSTGLAIGFRAVLNLILTATEKLMISRNVSAREVSPDDTFSATSTYFLLLPCFLVPLLLAIAVTALVSPAAAGSGIPRMKAVFGGVYLPRFLSLPTLCAKVIGLLGSVASGISVGSEGPFVHIACCIAAVLLRIPWFRYLNRNIVRRHGVLAMACVAGVVAAFGTPFGGLLFAVEVVATYFKISDLPQMFWSALVGVLLVWLSDNNTALLALFETDFVLKRITYLSMISSALLGALCGLLGGLFALLMRRVGNARRNLDKWFLSMAKRQHRERKLTSDPSEKAVPDTSLLYSAKDHARQPSRRDDCYDRLDRCCSGRLQRCYPRSYCRPVASGRVWVAVTLGVILLFVQFSMNFVFALYGFPSVFDQRQLIQELFNTSLSRFGNYSPDNAYGYGPNTSCPALGEPFEVVPSTFVPAAASTDNGSHGFFFSNGAVTLPIFLLFLTSRFLVTPFALQLPLIPSGLFTPIFLLGALIGRAWGVLGACLLQNVHFQTTSMSAAITTALSGTNITGLDGAVSAAFSEISAAEYAILGAAAFAGATTRTISTVIIVMELTGSLYLQLPVAVCVLTAYFVADGISPSVYELMQSLDSLPVLPAVDDSLSQKRAVDAMESIDATRVIIPPLTVGQARRLLDATAGGEVQFISVVESAETMILVGEVQRMSLVNTILDFEEYMAAKHHEQRDGDRGRRRVSTALQNLENSLHGLDDDADDENAAFAAGQRRIARLRRSKTLSAMQRSQGRRWSTKSTTYGATAEAATDRWESHDAALADQLSPSHIPRGDVENPSLREARSDSDDQLAAEEHDEGNDTPIHLVATSLDSTSFPPGLKTSLKVRDAFTEADDDVSASPLNGSDARTPIAATGVDVRPYMTMDQVKYLRDRKSYNSYRHNASRDFAGDTKDRAPPLLTVPIDLSALQVSWSTPLFRINILVHMLRM
eukprot:INCI14770.4.p1 GENE.INCI14770.4~~INCI14770.4.p1  ORF type:complete len:1129 (+),score=166.11 INCI14770.4:204-3590(+)